MSKCIDDVTSLKAITVLAKQKQWMTAEVRALLKTWNAAFKSDNKAAPRARILGYQRGTENPWTLPRQAAYVAHRLLQSDITYL